jgi:hypothetical protein
MLHDDGLPGPSSPLGEEVIVEDSTMGEENGNWETATSKKNKSKKQHTKSSPLASTPPPAKGVEKVKRHAPRKQWIENSIP